MSFRRSRKRPLQTSRLTVTQAKFAKASARGARSASRAQNRAVSLPSPGLMKQVRALVKAKQRDAADVSRGFVYPTGDNYTVSCLTSSESFATAPSLSGLLDTDADEVMINSVRMKGEMQIPARVVADPDGDVGTRVRKIVVWFNKPATLASAAGTLPLITEVLAQNSINSMPLQKASQGGRFVILSDRTWNLGRNEFYFAAGPPPTIGTFTDGKSRTPFDYTVKVNRTCKFVAPSSSGPGAGGHYDSDQPAGQISHGLLVCYTLHSSVAPQNMQEVCHTRLNYTG